MLVRALPARRGGRRHGTGRGPAGARPDEDGYIWIIGRVADSFISHGQVVHPGDVERILLSHPAVAEAGVVAIPESSKEQVVTAFVVVASGAETTEQELLAWCREHLAAHQVPAFVTFAGRLLRNSVGKLIRAELQNRYAQVSRADSLGAVETVSQLPVIRNGRAA